MIRTIAFLSTALAPMLTRTLNVGWALHSLNASFAPML